MVRQAVYYFFGFSFGRMRSVSSLNGTFSALDMEMRTSTVAHSLAFSMRCMVVLAMSDRSASSCWLRSRDSLRMRRWVPNAFTPSGFFTTQRSH